MPAIKIRIPGKVMLSGEYAVLYGATSVLVPVSRYVEVTEINRPPESDYSPVVMSALRQEIAEIADFELEHGLPFIHLDCGQFFDKNVDGEIVKLGLGCSAAEAVGVITLRFDRAGRSPVDHKDAILKYALDAHSQAQSGMGSGADVAVCAYGTPIKFRRTGDHFRVDEIAKNKSVSLKHLNLLWSGQPANTREMVGRFQNWVENGDIKSRELMARLIDTSNELADAWYLASEKELFILLDKFDLAMMACAEESGVPYKIPVHEEIEAWAKNHGGRAKPTGAGGGDMILLIGDLPIYELDKLVIPLTS